MGWRNMELQLYDLARMRKAHPCGATDWVVIRVGADIKIKCTGCGRIVMLTREAFEKRCRKIIAHEGETGYGQQGQEK